MIISDLKSPLAEYFYEFVRMKRSMGYKYDDDKLYWLRILDKISFEYSRNKIALSKEIVEKWEEQRPNESIRNLQRRIRFSNEIAEFLIHRNIEAYIIPIAKSKFNSASSFVPYVFTHDQIKDFLLATDRHPPSRNNPNSNKMYSFLFRLLYCCGLRISEALDLKYNDIDLKNNVLTIRDGKFGKDRIVPMSATLSSLCCEYTALSKAYNPSNPHIFSNRFTNDSITSRSVYGYYRKILWEAGIPYGGRGNGPRLHDFRHIFAVHSLHNLADSGVDVCAILPILAAYLGHDDLKITGKYLRLTSEVYPDIIKQVENYSGDIIPEVRFYETD